MIKYESKSTNETERVWNLGLLVKCTLESHFERHFKFCSYLVAKSSVVWLTYQSFQEKKKASDEPIYVGKGFSKPGKGQDQHQNTGWVVACLELFLSYKAWGISQASWGLIQSCNILNQWLLCWVKPSFYICKASKPSSLQLCGSKPTLSMMLKLQQQHCWMFWSRYSARTRLNKGTIRGLTIKQTSFYLIAALALSRLIKLKVVVQASAPNVWEIHWIKSLIWANTCGVLCCN